MATTTPQPPNQSLSSKTKHGLLISGIVIVFLLGLFYLTGIFDQESAKNDLTKYFDWVVNDADLTEPQIDKFYQRYLLAKEILEDNSDHFQAWLNLGEAKLGVEDYEGARDAWEYLSEIRPLNSLSYGNLAALYTYNIYDPERAKFNYERAITNSIGEPFNPKYYRNFAEFYLYFEEDIEKAEQVLLEGIEVNPETGDLYVFLASMYADAGRLADAIEQYGIALNLDPSNKPIRDELERLRNLNNSF